VKNRVTVPVAKSDNKRVTASGLLSQAKAMDARGDYVGELAIYQKLTADFFSSPELANWQKRIEDLNIKLIFSPVITQNSVSYQIKPGDTLAKIAKEFNTTVELIKKSNNLSDDKILPGKKIKVWNAPFNILVNKSQNVLLLKTNEEVFKTYTVSTGTNNCTPIGTFKIVEKLVNPTWFKAGAVVASGSPENVLGTRWMGFNISGYGIHGTVEPQNLGKQVTQGCVRMANPEVEELYMIVPKGTEVTIID
jgi:lipoprotein-anchoring transpeptidase ErfK/SrfK